MQSDELEFLKRWLSQHDFDIEARATKASIHSPVTFGDLYSTFSQLPETKNPAVDLNEYFNIIESLSHVGIRGYDAGVRIRHYMEVKTVISKGNE